MSHKRLPLSCNSIKYYSLPLSTATRCHLLSRNNPNDPYPKPSPNLTKNPVGGENLSPEMELPPHVSYPHTVHFQALKKNKVAQGIYQLSENLPITFPMKAKYRGTIKLHGTNASLIFRDGNTEDATYQSRNRVITKEVDNHGTVALLSTAGVEQLAQEVVRISGSTNFLEIMIAGELGGLGIQRGVGIANIDLFFCIFNIRIDGVWADMGHYASVEILGKRIFNIMNYLTFEAEIDMGNDTEAVYEQLMSYTTEVGAKCPFAASFKGPDGKPIVGNGEGIVWTLIPDPGHHQSLRSELVNFKTKVEGFMTTAPQRKVPLNVPERERSSKFVEYAVTERRLEQGVEYMREMRKGFEKANVGDYIKWVAHDTLREEGGVMKEMGADEKIVKKLITHKAKVFWIRKCLE